MSGSGKNGTESPPNRFTTQRQAIRQAICDPSTWGPFENAVNGLERGFDGIGFVFSEKDPFCGIDLDECRDPVSGEVAPWAARIVKDFDSYTEVSPSKTGLKIFIKGRLSGGGIKTKYAEVYDKTRYFTVTGRYPPS